MNEDGEFELVLGNKQLFSVFFVVAVLFGVCFLMGYTVGKNSAPALSASIASKEDREPLVIPPATQPAPAEPKVEQKEPEVAAPAETPVVETQPQKPAAPPQRVESVKTAPPKTEPAKPALPGFEKLGTTALKQAPLGSQPIPGRVYLQLTATERDSAEGMADLLRGKRFPAIASQVPERPQLYRVLVGPLNEADLAKTRADLKANSFPSDEAVRRVF